MSNGYTPQRSSFGAQLHAMNHSGAAGSIESSAGAPSAPAVDEILPQAPITTRTEWGDRDAELRRATGGSRPEHRYGLVTNGDETHVVPLELVLVERRGSSNGRSMFPGTNAAKGTTSLTGIPLRPGMVQEDLMRAWQVMGISRTAFVNNDPGQPKNGFTTQISGSGTVPNNGKDTFSPGDLIGWRMVPIDLTEREQYMRTLKPIPGRHPGKFTPIVTRADPRDVNDIMGHAAEWLLDDNVPAEAKSVHLLHNAAAKLTNTEEVALSLKNFILRAVWAGVGRLQERGLITVNTPGGDQERPEQATEAGTYEPWLEPLDTPLYEMYDEQMLFTPENLTAGAGGTAVERATREGQVEAGDGSAFDVETDKRRERLWYLAHILGIAPEDARKPHLVPSEMLADSIVGTVVAGLHSDAETQEAFDTAKMLGLSDEAVRGQRRLANRSFSETNGMAQLVKGIESAARTHQVSYSSAVYEARSRIFGIALNPSQPGAALDFRR